MRYLILPCALALLLAPAVHGQDLGNSLPSYKGDGHVLQNPGTPDGREGGETLADAVVIPNLPFQDTGNTCDNLNDYDEVCPYSGSTSPDVVYAYTPPSDRMIAVDLCNSHYDTKVYIYCETPGSLVGCNDDYCSNQWTPYASLLENVHLFGGFTYYIVVDGYGGDCGEYDLQIAEYCPCVVECPDESIPEGEPPLVDWYVDEHNGGCNSTPPVFQWINWTNWGDLCAWLCGVSGWYYAGDSYRDTDWFPVLAEGYQIDVTLTAEYETNLYLLFPPDCNTVGVVASATVPPCVPTLLSYPTTPGMEIWIWVGPSTFSGPVNEYAYFLHVCGILYDVIPTEQTSWGELKERYR